jgi:hypothetical protein
LVANRAHRRLRRCSESLSLLLRPGPLPLPKLPPPQNVGAS